MRKFTGAATAIILAIAVYFVLVWGFEALRMLSSPAYGLDDVWRSQFVFAIGRMLSLTPLGLIKLAAFFATLKLAVAVICLAFVAERIRKWPAGKGQSDVLEAGLILVVIISILSVGPAVWSQNVGLLREHTIQLALAGLAAALCLIERNGARPAETEPDPLHMPRWYTPWR